MRCDELESLYEPRIFAAISHGMMRILCGQVFES